MYKKVTDKHIKRVKELANEYLFFRDVSILYKEKYPEDIISESTIKKIIRANGFPYKKRKKGALEGIEKYTHEDKSIREVTEEFNADHPERNVTYQMVHKYIKYYSLPYKKGKKHCKALKEEMLIEEPFYIVEEKILKAKQRLKEGKIKPIGSEYYKKGETK